MNNHNIGKAFERLIGDMYYKYRNYRAEKLSNGNVLVVLKEMTIPEFHQWVDDLYNTIDKSITPAFKQKSPCHSTNY